MSDVIVAAMRSPSGASAHWLGEVLDQRLKMLASVPLFFVGKDKGRILNINYWWTFHIGELGRIPSTSTVYRDVQNEGDWGHAKILIYTTSTVFLGDFQPPVKSAPVKQNIKKVSPRLNVLRSSSTKN